MTSEILSFECITPCFCAGADQTKGEIRPSSIRGALRWWFRCLGGTKDQEAQVFGGVDPVRSSALLTRVSNVVPKNVELPQVKGVDPLSYILYFPSVAADKSRWNREACFGPGTRFDLHLRQLRRLPSECESILQSAISSFRHHGSIGMHATRGLGAIQDIAASPQSFNQADETLKAAGFTIRRAKNGHKTWDSVLKEAGKWLKFDLRKEFGAGGYKKPPQATALGHASPRQTSAVHLRPIMTEGRLYMSAFEAPHQLILAPPSRRPHAQPVLETRDFTQQPPIA